MGLYDQDNKAVTSGALKLLDYWRAKFNAEQLEEALKTRQPEGVIGLELVSAVSLLDDLLKTYPNHEELKGWRERAMAVQAMIDPEASRRESFDGRNLWHEHSYREAYVGYYSGQFAEKEGDSGFAKDGYRTALQKLSYLAGRLEANDRVADWPTSVPAWIRETKAELEKR
ncbi:MAG: hypothetical protein V4671_01990 [Armatimonadota bacterium]